MLIESNRRVCMRVSFTRHIARPCFLSVCLSVSPAGQPRLHGVYTNWPHLEPVYTPAARLLTSAIFRPQRKGLSTAHQLNRLQLSLSLSLSLSVSLSSSPNVRYTSRTHFTKDYLQQAFEST